VRGVVYSAISRVMRTLTLPDVLIVAAIGRVAFARSPAAAEPIALRLDDERGLGRRG
jgi:hypothetical protein